MQLSKRYFLLLLKIWFLRSVRLNEESSDKDPGSFIASAVHRKRSLCSNLDESFHYMAYFILGGEWVGDYVTCVQHFKVQQKGHVLVLWKEWSFGCCTYYCSSYMRLGRFEIETGKIYFEISLTKLKTLNWKPGYTTVKGNGIYLHLP